MGLATLPSGAESPFLLTVGTGRLKAVPLSKTIRAPARIPRSPRDLGHPVSWLTWELHHTSGTRRTSRSTRPVHPRSLPTPASARADRAARGGYGRIRDRRPNAPHHPDETRQSPDVRPYAPPPTRAFSLLLCIPEGGCSGVFIAENAHRYRSPTLHLQGKCSRAYYSTIQQFHHSTCGPARLGPQ